MSAGLSFIDIIVMVVIFAGVTYMGHLLSGSISDRVSFFQAGGSMPWWAVSSSIIATVVSSVTFISVPAKVFSDGGNLLYVQVIIGLMLGKLVTSAFFARPYYESTGISTTYDYISKRMDSNVGNFAMYLGLGLSLINTAVKLLTTGLVLAVVTDWPLINCCLIIVAFSILWSWLAGLKTVIWTDFILFIIFAFGAVFAMFWITALVEMPFAEAMKLLDDRAKTALFDLSVDPHVTYTLWAGIIGSVTSNLALASSQATFQRVRACRNTREAKLAYNFSALFYFVHICILVVGLAMVVFYHENPLPPEFVADLADEPDRIFPYFIVTEIPVGISGMLIAAIFAAGISTLDTALAEVADITITNVYERYFEPNAPEEHYLVASRIALIVWGLLYFAVAMMFSTMMGEGLLDLTFKLPGFLFGAMFGTIMLARFGIGTYKSYFIGFIVSCSAVALMFNAGIGFFWWCPVSGLLMIAVVWGIDRSKPEMTGIVTADAK